MTRRGVALIIVLASCVVILTAASVVARVRATSALNAGATDGLAIALEVADASEGPTLAWLRHESRDVVLEPSSSLQGVPILSDRLRVDGREIAVTVIAWDQCAMLPNADLTELAALRRLASDARPGWLAAANPGADISGGFAGGNPSDATATRFATHNPSPHERRQRGGAAAVINVNTAPEPLLRAVCEDLGIGGVEQMLATRRSEEKITAAETTGRSGTTRLRLVTASPVWSTRTDIRIGGPGGVSVSVWSVYTLRGGTWTLEQRFVITD